MDHFLRAIRLTAFNVHYLDDSIAQLFTYSIIKHSREEERYSRAKIFKVRTFDFLLCSALCPAQCGVVILLRVFFAKTVV